ncbi:MAG: GntR family transcriptional regulator [Actinobacteria bacterium]|nr:GntR family transcriptional regulator [Actinomycetota bacterium]
MSPVNAQNAEQIAEELRLRIRCRQWPPGMTINQKQLAADLGVSRIPVREALQALNSEGLVILSPGQGASVVELDRDDIADLYDLRLSLEPPMATDVIEGLSPRDHQRLADLSEMMHEARTHTGGDDDLHRDRWSNLNHEFHERMYAATGRRHSVRVVLQIMELVEPYSRLYVHLLGGIARASDEHDAMVDAIEQRDADTLSDLVSTHLDGARRELLDERWWTNGHFAVPPGGAGDIAEDAVAHHG